MDDTKVYDSNEVQNELISETLIDVAEILEERGYNAVNQIVGYLLSGDPGYISSHKEARSKLCKFDRAKTLETIVESFLSKK